MSEVASQSLKNRTICYCCLDLCVINTETDKRRCADMLEECYGIVMPKQVSGMCGVCRASLRAALAFRRQVKNCSLLLTGQIEQKQSTTNIYKDLDTGPMVVETVGDADSENDVSRDQKEEMNMAENYDDDNSVYSEDYLEDDFYDEQNYEQDNESSGREIKINIKSRTVPDSSPIKIEIRNRYDRKPMKEERKNSNQTRARIKLEPLHEVKMGKPSSKYTHVRSERDPHFTKRYSNNRINMTKLLYASTLIPFNTKSSMFICLYCTDSDCYSTMDQLKEHMAMAHENMKFSQVLRSCVKKRTPRINVEASEAKCKACNNGVQFRTLKALVDHLINEHKVTFLESDTKPQDTVLPFKLNDSENACFCCGEVFQTFKMLMLHANTHFGDYVCEICGKGFPMRANLSTHSKTHLKYYVICPICGKQLNKNNLSQHIQFSHKRQHCCAFCSKVFKTMSQKRHHEIDFHGKYKNLATTCEICGKEYAYYNLLRAHIRNVHMGLKPEKQFECNECGNRYKDKSALRHHMYSHFGENQFQCMVCEKKLKTQRCLSNHMKIHMNDLRWSCALCKKRFSAKPSLRNHIAFHHEDYGSELMVYSKD